MIVDASVAFKWFVAEEHSGDAIGLLARDDLMAPALVHAEVGNALWKKVARGEFAGADDLSVQLMKLTSLVRTVDETPMVARALEMAVVLKHPIYGCVYLALAEALGEILVTADRKFVAKVTDSDYASLVRKLA